MTRRLLPRAFSSPPAALLKPCSSAQAAAEEAARAQALWLANEEARHFQHARDHEGAFCAWVLGVLGAEAAAGWGAEDYEEERAATRGAELRLEGVSEGAPEPGGQRPNRSADTVRIWLVLKC